MIKTGVKLYGVQNGYGHWNVIKSGSTTRDVNTGYISSSTDSSAYGAYGLFTIDGAYTLTNTNIASETISATTNYGYTGSAVETRPYKYKTIYISAASLGGISNTGACVNIEGSYNNTSEWYTIWNSEIYTNGKYYFSFDDYHPWMRTRISGLASGQGTWMTVITGRS